MEYVHKAQRLIHRKKRARAYVREVQKHALKNKELGRLRSLKVVRATRFNSRVQVLDSFLENCRLMRRVVANPGFQDMVKARKPHKSQGLGT